MPVSRATVIGIILGCSLYAAFVLLYKGTTTDITSPSLRQGAQVIEDMKFKLLHPGQSQQAVHVKETLPISAPPLVADTPQHLTIEAASEPDEQPAQQHHSFLSEFKAPPSITELFHSITTPTTHEPSEPIRSSDELTCRGYLEKHAVIPGVSWGTLPTELQKSWKDLQCDNLVKKDIENVATVVDQAAPVPTPPVAPPPSKKGNKPRRGKKETVAGIADVNKDNKAWCHESKEKYNVIPMRSWGNLPMNYVETWRNRRCDLIFTTERMSARPLSSCPDLSSSSSGGGGGGGDAAGGKKGHSNLRDDLPLIAVMAATTTRKIDKPSTKNLSLFMYLLPSLIRTLDCGFRYEYVMGYDKGDPFYDSKEGMAEVQQWWKDNVEEPMRKNGIRITLRLVKVNNTIKKPGPVFLEMARAAYKDGAAYFYRINDDTELMVNWAAKYVEGLSTLSVPFGVVGPLCNQGNEKILTHDFTSRLHMEIFEMNYYPPELVDWWMDDWISLVYGRARTFKARSVPVMHHTGTHGTRYAVDSANGQRLSALVEAGRKKIRHYMLTHGVPENVLKEFDMDEYKAFTHRDLPPSKLKQ